MHSQERPETELALLRTRLEDAEDMQRAIAGGEVDGFVVGANEARKQVLLLSHAYLRYRQLVERMQHGAVTVSTTGDILYANHRFARLIAEPLGRLFGAPLPTFVDPADAGALQHFLAAPEENSELTVRLRHSDGTLLPVHLLLAAFSDGYASILVTDLVPQERLEAAEETVDAIRRGKIDALVINDEQVLMLQNAQPRPEAFALLAGELKSHLALIRGSAAQLRRNSGPDTESQTAIATIERQVEMLNRLIEALLGISRPG